MINPNSSFKSLHIIRGICALIVVFYHAKFVLWCGGTLWLTDIGFKHSYDYFLFGLDMLSSCGKQCVLVFFLLSGFVIYNSFNQSDKKISHFYIIRVIRIYMPFLFSLFFSVLVLSLVGKLNPAILIGSSREYNTRLLTAFNDLNIVSILKAVFFIKSKEYAGFNFAYWSLLHEAIFYIFFPVYFFIGIRNRAILFVIILVAFIASRSNYLYYQLYFLMGMFLCDYYKTQRSLFFKNKAFFICIISASFILTNLLAKQSTPISADISALFTIVLIFNYLIAANVKDNKYLQKLADISFTLYLNHLPVLMICYIIFSKLFNKLIFYERYPYYTGVFFSVIISTIFFKFIEAKSLFLIKKLKGKWNL